MGNCRRPETAAELLKPIDDEQRRRYPQFVRPAAPRSRFASPGAKLIRFIGRRPRTSLRSSPSFPGCHRTRRHAREEANPYRDARRRHVTARRANSARDVGARGALDVRRIPPAAPSRIAGSRRCPAVVQEPHAVLPAATNPRVGRSRSISELGRRIMAERRRPRLDRRQRERERQRTFPDNDSAGPTDVRLRQLVRAIGRQAAREVFEAQRRKHSDSVH